MLNKLEIVSKVKKDMEIESYVQLHWLLGPVIVLLHVISANVIIHIASFIHTKYFSQST